MSLLLRLSANQQTLLNILAKHPSAAARTTTFETLGGRIDPGHMQKAWHVVVEAYEMLRVADIRKEANELWWLMQTELPQLQIVKTTDRREVGDNALRDWANTQGGWGWRAALFCDAAGAYGLGIYSHALTGDLGSHERVRHDLYAAYRASAGGTTWRRAQAGFDEALKAENAAAARNIDALKTFSQTWATAVTAIELPGERTHPPAPSLPVRTCRFQIPVELTRQVRAFAERISVPERSVYFATLAGLIARYMGRRRGEFRFLLGRRIASPRPEGCAPGAFETVAPIVVDTSDSPDVEDFARRIAESDKGIDVLAGVPQHTILEHGRLSAETGASNGSRVVFGWYEREDDPVVAPREVLSERSLALADLELALFKRGDAVSGAFEYSPDACDGETIENAARHYEAMLRRYVQDPRAKIDLVDFIADSEKQRLLVEWNATEVAFTGPMLVHRRFEQAAAADPTKVAVEDGNRKLTYAELNGGANRLAHYLRKHGIGPGKRVAIAIDRNVDLVTSLFAVMKAGGAYVPVDLLYPKDRIDQVFQDAGVALVITDATVAHGLPNVSCPVIRVDDDADTIATFSPENLDGGAKPTDAVYVIYTSGSTGAPKGVAIPHHALAQCLLSFAQKPGFTSSDTLLAVTTIAFDIAVLELYMPLICGGRVVMVQRDVVADGSRLREAYDIYKPTMIQATPVTWRLLMEAGWRGGPDLVALTGGEPLARKLADQLLERCKAVWNMYGPTETTVWSTVWQVKPGPRVFIGRPIANTQIYILDRNRQLVPTGVAGDLYIGGDGVAIGYHGREDLTNERFIKNPYSGTSARMYNTGDIARYAIDGNIEHLGRSDFQVKIRGFRVELGEIEGHLERHPGIRQAIAAVTRDQHGEPKLVAYIVPAAEPPTREEIHAFLATALPAHMLPSAYLHLPELPLTPNGKVDRRALPNAGAKPVPAVTSLEPLDEYETRIAEIWKDVLGVTEVAAERNFFELGGHSLLALRVQAKLETAFSRNVPISALFQYVTPRSLARFLRSDDSAPREPRAADVRGSARRASRNVVRKR